MYNNFKLFSELIKTNDRSIISTVLLSTVVGIMFGLTAYALEYTQRQSVEICVSVAIIMLAWIRLIILLDPVVPEVKK